jgi:hypothetical protein
MRVILLTIVAGNRASTMGVPGFHADNIAPSAHPKPLTALQILLSNFTRQAELRRRLVEVNSKQSAQVRRRGKTRAPGNLFQIQIRLLQQSANPVHAPP